MTIFSKLRYHLSDPPTLEEIQLLPVEVFNKFSIKFSPFCDINALYSYLDVAWYGGCFESYQKYMTELRYIIFRLDE